jgi:hypothetical protein
MQSLLLDKNGVSPWSKAKEKKSNEEYYLVATKFK